MCPQVPTQIEKVESQSHFQILKVGPPGASPFFNDVIFFFFSEYIIFFVWFLSSFFNPIKPGGMEVIFARGKFKFKLFLNGLWYEPETL